jgi:hypothetical protein
MTAPDSEPWGTSPPNPLGFSAWGREQKGRRTNDRPPAPEGLCPLHDPALGLRPRRALPSEPHKQGSTQRKPVLCFSQFPARQRRRADTKQEPLLYLSKSVLLSSAWGAAQCSERMYSSDVDHPMRLCLSISACVSLIKAWLSLWLSHTLTATRPSLKLCPFLVTTKTEPSMSIL